jgi:hypothetical protein
VKEVMGKKDDFDKLEMNQQNFLNLKTQLRFVLRQIKKLEDMHGQQKNKLVGSIGEIEKKTEELEDRIKEKEIEFKLSEN